MLTIRPLPGKVVAEQGFFTRRVPQASAGDECLSFREVRDQIGSCVERPQQKHERSIVENVNVALRRIQLTDRERHTAVCN